MAVTEQKNFDELRHKGLLRPIGCSEYYIWFEF